MEVKVMIRRKRCECLFLRIYGNTNGKYMFKKLCLFFLFLSNNLQCRKKYMHPKSILQIFISKKPVLGKLFKFLI